MLECYIAVLLKAAAPRILHGGICARLLALTTHGNPATHEAVSRVSTSRKDNQHHAASHFHSHVARKATDASAEASPPLTHGSVAPTNTGSACILACPLLTLATASCQQQHLSPASAQCTHSILAETAHPPPTLPTTTHPTLTARPCHPSRPPPSQASPTRRPPFHYHRTPTFAPNLPPPYPRLFTHHDTRSTSFSTCPPDTPPPTVPRRTPSPPATYIFIPDPPPPTLPSPLDPSSYILPSPSTPDPAHPPTPTATSTIQHKITQAPTWAHLHSIITHHLLDFDPPTLALALSTLATLLPPGPAHSIQGVSTLLTQLDTITPSLLRTAHPSDLATILWAWSRLGHATPLPHAVARLSQHGLLADPSAMSGSLAASLIISLTRLDVGDPHILRALLHACMLRLGETRIEQHGALSDALASLASAAAPRAADPPVRRALAKCSELAAQLTQHLTIPQLAHLATAFVQAGVAHDVFLSSAARRIAPRLGRAEQLRSAHMRARLLDTVQLCWALTAAGHHDADLLHHIASIVTPLIPELPPLAMVYICAAYGERGQYDAALFDAAAAHSARRVVSMSPADCASMCASFAAVEHRDTAALDAIMGATASRLRSCSVGTVTSIAEACACLAHLPEWYAVISARAVLSLPVAPGTEAAAVGYAVSTAWALAAAGHAGSEVFRPLVLRMLEWLGECWPRDGGQPPLDAHQAAQVVGTVIAAGGAELMLAEHLPLAGVEFVMAAWADSKVRSPGVSKALVEVAGLLTKKRRWEVRWRVEELGGLLEVPLAVVPPAGARVAVESFGELACARNDRGVRLGGSVLREQLLRGCGWNVVYVAEATWNERDEKGRWRFLKWIVSKLKLGQEPLAPGGGSGTEAGGTTLG